MVCKESETERAQSVCVETGSTNTCDRESVSSSENVEPNRHAGHVGVWRPGMLKSHADVGLNLRAGSVYCDSEAVISETRNHEDVSYARTCKRNEDKEQGMVGKNMRENENLCSPRKFEPIHSPRHHTSVRSGVNVPPGFSGSCESGDYIGEKENLSLHNFHEVGQPHCVEKRFVVQSPGEMSYKKRKRMN